MNFKSNNLTAHFGLILTLTLVISIFVSSPIASIFEIDPDEGVNLGKAMLVEQGYKLYSQIWSDQPPLFTYILAWVIRAFGNSLVAARLVTLALSGLLLWTCFKIMETFNNFGMAVISALLLILTDPFLRISYAVMVGLPAIALATLSVYAMMQWHKSGKTDRLVLSAIALALSVATKLFTVILLPLLFLGVLISGWKQSNKKMAFVSKYRASLIWTSLFTVISGAIFWFFVGVVNVQQLIQPHIEATSIGGFDGAGITFSPVLLGLAGLGAVLILWDKNWLMIYPFAWMLVAYFLLANHSPAWYHQKLLFTVPAVMVAAYSIYDVYVSLSKVLQSRALPKWIDFRSYLSLAGLVLLLAYLSVAATVRHFEQSVSRASVLTNIPRISNEKQKKNLLLVERYASETEWMLTDLPMYAFRAGILMPPNTAVITQKRILTGNLTEKDLIEAIADYQPEQVLLGRFEFPNLAAYLNEGYSLISCKGDGIRLYLRSGMAETTDLTRDCE